MVVVTILNLKIRQCSRLVHVNSSGERVQTFLLDVCPSALDDLGPLLLFELGNTFHKSGHLLNDTIPTILFVPLDHSNWFLKNSLLARWECSGLILHKLKCVLDLGFD